MGMDKFSEEVRRGMQDVQQVGGQLSQIIQQVQALAPRVEAVNEGMQAQATGAEQITQALAQLSEAAQQTVESLRQSSQAIDELNQVATGMRSGVSRFTLRRRERPCCSCCFNSASDRYALDVRQIAEVLPLVDIKPIPQAPRGVAGIFNYRGAPVPVIDLSQLTLGRPARTAPEHAHRPRALSRRRRRDAPARPDRRTGDRDHAARAGGLRRRPASPATGAPYLGPVATDARGLLQWIDVATLLPAVGARRVVQTSRWTHDGARRLRRPAEGRRSGSTRVDRLVGHRARGAASG